MSSKISTPSATFLRVLSISVCNFLAAIVLNVTRFAPRMRVVCESEGAVYVGGGREVLDAAMQAVYESGVEPS